MIENLPARIEEVFALPQTALDEKESLLLFNELKAALNTGHVRAAEPTASGWRVNSWVKKGILLGFRVGRTVEFSSGGFQFADKDTFPLRDISTVRNVRVVPGGTAIRDGCYIASGVICMPPSYINVGAYVDEGTMIDSHVLVGSCAQIGKRGHLSAGVQIGGVLEPIGGLPVIVEDDVLVGGNCGVYEGVVVGSGAVLAPGTMLTGSTPLYDLVRGTVYRREAGASLRVPPRAVVVSGARAVAAGFGAESRLSLYAPVIVKYRDEKTDRAVQLEEILRERL